MTSQNFAYWLMGYFEVAQPKQIGTNETEMIKRHLALVFKHEIDPAMGDEKHQAQLNAIHSPNTLDSYLRPPHEDGVLRC